MPTLCIFHPEFMKRTIGGAEVQCYLMGTELIKIGWNVIYVSEAFEKPTEEEGMKLIPFNPIKNNERSAIMLAKILKENNVDICYQRGRKLYTWLACRASQIISIPFVNAFSMDVDFKKHKFLFRNINSIKTLVSHLIHFRKLYMMDWYSLTAIKKADNIFFQSNYQKEQAKLHLGIEGEVVRNIHSVPLEREINKACKKNIVLWLATIREWKQPEIFMQLAKELEKEDIQFILAGNIAKNKYKKQIAEHENSIKNFKYMPCRTLEQSNHLISMANIFVNTSKKDEGFPNTFIQSWLRRTIVVSLNFDPDDLLSQKGLGCLSGSLEKMKNDILEILKNRKMRDEIADRAELYALENYSIENNVNKISKNLKSIIAPHKKY